MPTHLGTSRFTAYGTVFLVWSFVALYAVAHDQYVASIEPRHFTEYHAPIAGMEDVRALAAAHALNASVGPGLLLGLGCVIATSAGQWPTLRCRLILGGVLVVLVLTEATALLSDTWMKESRSPFFPIAWFPEPTPSIVRTQTIQLTTYLAGATYSSLLLAVLTWLRWHQRNIR